MLAITSRTSGLTNRLLLMSARGMSAALWPPYKFYLLPSQPLAGRLQCAAAVDPVQAMFHVGLTWTSIADAHPDP